MLGWGFDLVKFLLVVVLMLAGSVLLGVTRWMPCFVVLFDLGGALLTLRDGLCCLDSVCSFVVFVGVWLLGLSLC